MRDINWAPLIMDRATWQDHTGVGPVAPLATSKVTINMPFSVDPADLGAVAKFEDITRKVMENMHAAIEARLQALLADGISIDRIRLEQRPDGSTAIVVDNIPNSTFRITYADDRL